MDELIYASVTALAKAIRDKRVSAVEVVEAHLRRIEAVNPALNAVVQMAGDRARAEARAADQALARGEIRGPLHGVPMTIKDSLDTAGVVSTGGTTGRATFVPERDATVVARLRAAGAILLGKTNTPELTLAGETDNLVYGRTNNPYDVSRTPGGSSAMVLS
jgi:amidase